jgi:hypothetical protein
MINLFEGCGNYGCPGTATQEFQNWAEDAFPSLAGGNPVLDPNRLKGAYGRSDIDIRCRFVGAALW